MWASEWSDALRQGDVLGPLALPLLGQQFTVQTQAQSLTSASAPQPIRSVLLQAEERHIVIVSHDCEFNEAKRNKLLVARIQAIPGNLGAGQREALRESNDVRSRVAAGHPIAAVDSFLLSPLPEAFEEEHVVSFTTITPLPMTMQGELRDVKRGEMTSEARLLFMDKLAWFFARKDVTKVSESD